MALVALCVGAKKVGVGEYLSPAMSKTWGGAKFLGDKAVRVGVPTTLVGLLGMAVYSAVEWAALMGYAPEGYKPAMEWPYPPILLVTSLVSLVTGVEKWTHWDDCHHEWVSVDELETKGVIQGSIHTTGKKYVERCSKCEEFREKEVRINNG